MSADVLTKIRKAAEARDKAIAKAAKNGICAPCGESLDCCMCEAWETLGAED